MTSTTRNEDPVVGPMRQRRTNAPMSTGNAGLFTLLWLIFLSVLIFEPERLDAVWSWFRDLPIFGQALGWILLLPLALGLWIWQAPMGRVDSGQLDRATGADQCDHFLASAAAEHEMTAVPSMPGRPEFCAEGASNASGANGPFRRN